MSAIDTTHGEAVPEPLAVGVEVQRFAVSGLLAATVRAAARLCAACPLTRETCGDCPGRLALARATRELTRGLDELDPERALLAT